MPQEAGGTHFGVIQTARFISSLCICFPRFKFAEEILDAITEHYGIGYVNPSGYPEQIGWMDFCEDVGDAVDNHPEQVPTRLAHARSARLSFETLSAPASSLVDL